MKNISEVKNIGEVKDIGDMKNIGGVQNLGEYSDIMEYYTILSSLIIKGRNYTKEIKINIMGRTGGKNQTKKWLKNQDTNCKTLDFPIVTYGSESWTTRGEDRRSV